MIREFAVAREYLDEVAIQVERMVRRHHRARSADPAPEDVRALAELDLEIARTDDLIRARCDASAAVGIELPLDRLRRAWRRGSGAKRNGRPRKDQGRSRVASLRGCVGSPLGCRGK